MTLVTAKWSLEEYHSMVESGVLDDRHVELINGEIIEMPPEGAEHSYYCCETVQYLRTMLEARATVREAHPITLPNNSEPEPDIAIVRPSNTRYRQQHPQVSDIYWLIEIANTTLARDLGPKRELYAAAGIAEYWVIDLQSKTLVVFSDLQDGDYRSETSQTNGIVIPNAFLDIALDIQRILG
jgi:Uma2 family endonuclease